MSNYRREQRSQDISTESRLNQSERDGVAESVSTMGQTVIQPGTSLHLPQLDNNFLYLAAGQHTSIVIDKAGTVIQCAPGAVTAGLWTIDAPGKVIRITGMRFLSQLSPMVTITAGTYVIFTDCIFTKPEPAVTTSFVAVAATAKASFIGCEFGPAKATAGFVVNNAGALLNVYVQGGINLTGQTHQNVTIISELS